MCEKLTKLFGSHLINLDLLPIGAIIIDAGACIGNFTEDIQIHAVSPSVFMLEPHEGNIESLEARKFEWISSPTTLIKSALVGSDVKKEVTFYQKEGFIEWGNVNNMYKTKTGKEYQVSTISLKSLLALINEPVIHYLKMDIEGSEWGVIADMDEETAEVIEQISMELHDVNFRNVTEKLESLGYEVTYDNGELYAVRKKS
jgi:FkbM family methyltransferase